MAPSSRPTSSRSASSLLLEHALAAFTAPTRAQVRAGPPGTRARWTSRRWSPTWPRARSRGSRRRGDGRPDEVVAGSSASGREGRREPDPPRAREPRRSGSESVSTTPKDGGSNATGLVLASTSPRRAAFLEQAGLTFTKVDPQIGDQDEDDLGARWRAFGATRTSRCPYASPWRRRSRRRVARPRARSAASRATPWSTRSSSDGPTFAGKPRTARTRSR